MKLIFEYIKRHWISFLLSTMFLTLEAAADLLQPTFMSYIVDRGIKNADVDQILHYGLIANQVGPHLRKLPRLPPAELAE